uniref:Uncharacterized protein n=1 Tax=Human herpesvirus 1 TaxID=10298 RepID=A0A2Z4H435_HHV1|nr:hypothetical protein [Human alphaherpesvirus 1]
MLNSIRAQLGAVIVGNRGAVVRQKRSWLSTAARRYSLFRLSVAQTPYPVRVALMIYWAW